MESHGVERWEAAHKPEHTGANILHELKAQIDATVTNNEEKDAMAGAIALDVR